MYHGPDGGDACQGGVRHLGGGRTAARVEYTVGDALNEEALGLAFAATAGLADRLGIAVSVVGGGTMKPLLMFDGDEVLEEMRRNIVSAFSRHPSCHPSHDERRRGVDCVHLL